MLKNIGRFLFVLVLMVAFSAIVFFIPFPRNMVFWMAYGSGLLANIVFFFVMVKAASRDESVISRFLGIPILAIGLIYLILQLALSFLFMAIAASCVIWVPIIISVVLLAVAFVGTLEDKDAAVQPEAAPVKEKEKRIDPDEIEFLEIEAEEIEEVHERKNVKVQGKKNLMQELLEMVEPLSDQVTEAESSKLLKVLAEEIKGSSPVRNDSLNEIENELMDQTIKLVNAVETGDVPEINNLCKKVASTLAERNRLTKKK